MIQGLAQLYNKQRKNILNHFFSGSCYAQEGMKNTKKNFDQYLTLSRKRYKMAIVTMEEE